jgi:hypothetical protein
MFKEMFHMFSIRLNSRVLLDSRLIRYYQALLVVLKIFI